MVEEMICCGGFFFNSVVFEDDVVVSSAVKMLEMLSLVALVEHSFVLIKEIGRRRRVE